MNTPDNPQDKEQIKRKQVRVEEHHDWQEEAQVGEQQGQEASQRDQTGSGIREEENRSKLAREGEQVSSPESNPRTADDPKASRGL